MNAAAITVFFVPLTTVPCFLWTQMASGHQSDDEDEYVQLETEREMLTVPTMVLPRSASEEGNGKNVAIVIDKPRRVTS